MWKKIEGFNYEVNTEGEIRRLGAKNKLKAPKSSSGYPHVGLCKNGSYTFFNVSRLVAMVHIGEIGPDDVVHHKDGDRTNNVVSNLEIVKNNDHCRNHSLTRANKLSSSDISSIRSSDPKTETIKSLMEKYDITDTYVRQILKGNTRMNVSPEKCSCYEDWLTRKPKKMTK